MSSGSNNGSACSGPPFAALLALLPVLWPLLPVPRPLFPCCVFFLFYLSCTALYGPGDCRFVRGVCQRKTNLSFTLIQFPLKKKCSLSRGHFMLKTKKNFDPKKMNFCACILENMRMFPQFFRVFLLRGSLWNPRIFLGKEVFSIPGV